MISRFAFAALLVVLPPVAAIDLSGQVPATAPTAAASQAVGSTQPDAPFATSALEPAVGRLRQTMGMLHIEKWKTSQGAREESLANIGSIQRDLDATLPPLLQTADSAPGSVTALLPAFRNVNALYDVVLRVTEVSKLAAPQQQSGALTDALKSLDEARRQLGDKVQEAAVSGEQQVKDLQKVVSSRPPAMAAPVAPPPQAAAVETHPKKKRKPAVKPAQTASPAAAPQPSKP